MVSGVSDEAEVEAVEEGAQWVRSRRGIVMVVGLFFGRLRKRSRG